jgi:hypothetical protein
MFYLRATFTDGHSVTLDERYDVKFRAVRAAGNYMRDFSDPCGTGCRVDYVSVIEEQPQ